MVMTRQEYLEASSHAGETRRGIVKAHVSMEQHQCYVCGVLYDTGAVLLHKKLRATLERYTVTAIGICPEHQKVLDDGYVILIESDPSVKGSRLGGLCYIRQEAWGNIFDTPIPEQGVALGDSETMKMVAAFSQGAEPEGE